MTLIVFLGSLLFTMALGVPIAFSLLLCGAALMWHMNMFDAQILAQNVIEGSNSFPLLAVPFFILAAELMSGGSLTDVLLRFASQFVGHRRGGLGYTNVVSLTFFSGTYFPIESLPLPVQALAWCTPLAHGVALSRALAFETPIANLWFHLAVLSLWALVGLSAAIVLFRRRMLK